jgi:hypothetical protein
MTLFPAGKSGISEYWPGKDLAHFTAQHTEASPASEECRLQTRVTYFFGTCVFLLTWSQTL